MIENIVLALAIWIIFICAIGVTVGLFGLIVMLYDFFREVLR